MVLIISDGAKREVIGIRIGIDSRRHPQCQHSKHELLRMSMASALKYPLSAHSVSDDTLSSEVAIEGVEGTVDGQWANGMSPRPSVSIHRHDADNGWNGTK